MLSQNLKLLSTQTFCYWNKNPTTVGIESVLYWHRNILIPTELGKGIFSPAAHLKGISPNRLPAWAPQPREQHRVEPEADANSICKKENENQQPVHQ